MCTYVTSRVRLILFELPLIVITIALRFGVVNTVMSDNAENYRAVQRTKRSPTYTKFLLYLDLKIYGKLPTLLLVYFCILIFFFYYYLRCRIAITSCYELRDSVHTRFSLDFRRFAYANRVHNINIIYITIVFTFNRNKRWVVPNIILYRLQQRIYDVALMFLRKPEPRDKTGATRDGIKNILSLARLPLACIIIRIHAYKYICRYIRKTTVSNMARGFKYAVHEFE